MSKPASQSPYLTTALEAVKQTEVVIRKYYQKEIESTLKSDNSPVTIADKEAERLIKEIVLEKFPDHAFLGEESGFETRESEYLWILDPIDGTKNYVKHIPLFGTQLALIKSDEVIVGVSNIPEMNELLYAEKGNGTYFNGNKISVSNISQIESSYLSFGHVAYFEKYNLLEGFLKLDNDTQGHRGFGDCWSYHLVATGRVEMMIEAHIDIWDIAAASILVEEAGGMVTDIKGKPINRDTTSILATNGVLHEQVLEYFKM